MASEVEKAIAWARSQVGSTQFSGKCQAFVAYCYYHGNGKLVSIGTATLAYKSWCVSTSKTNIPRGAAVYFNGSNPSIGHVGFYIGNGKVIHAYPSIKVHDLSAIPGYRGWGWNGGMRLKDSKSNSNVSSYNNPSGGGSSGGGSSQTGSGTTNTSTPSELTVTGTPEKVQVFHAQNKGSIARWGLLRYFEEIKTPSIGQNKANALLKLYNRKTRELKISDAFGDITVRGGTLIPVKLDLGDITTNNYMLVDSVTHKFTKDKHTMDLTLSGAWDE